MKREKELFCPSAFMKNSSLLIGRVNAQQEVDFFGIPIVIDDEFKRDVEKIGRPENRFRFATRCFSDDCAQWEKESSQCSVAGTVKNAIRNIDSDEKERKYIPKCGVRASCRWYSQEGVSVCLNCNLVITDTRSNEE